MNTFLIADTHFGHSNILTFESNRSIGTKLRPGFNNIWEHDEYLIQQWNSVVSPTDKVYHLGDVGFKNFTSMQLIFSRLNGEKVLIKGNHDNHKLSQYMQIFKDVRASHVIDKYVLTHIPIHPYSLDRWKANIHGHLHDNHIPDKRYYNVSVECLDDYKPIPFETIKEYYK